MSLPVNPSPLAQSMPAPSQPRPQKGSPLSSSSSSSHGMSVDEPPSLQPPSSLLLSFSLRIVARQDLSEHALLDLLVCTTCGSGLTAKSAADHVRSHRIPVQQSAKKQLNEELAGHALASQLGDLGTRLPNMAPVPYLAIYDGLSCRNCQYYCRTLSSHQTHSYADHPSEYDRTPILCKVQHFFNKNPQYFPVIPVLANIPATSQYAIYTKQNLPLRQAAAADAIVPASSDKEIPLLLKITGWHQHLESFLKTKAGVREIRLLVDTRITVLKFSWMGSRLRSTIIAYMKHVKRLCFEQPLQVRMLVMEYPR